MLQYLRYILIILFLSAIGHSAFTQTTVTGKVTDAETGEGLAYADVYFFGTDIIALTDFDGNYKLITEADVDSVVVEYVGYVKMAKPLQNGVTQTINFQLAIKTEITESADFEAGENPAWRVMRQVVRNKKKHDRRKLETFEYDAYTKIELDVNNISEKYKKKKIVRQIQGLMDSIQHLSGEDGKVMIPVFISESLSRFYYQKNPKRKKEYVKSTNISGLGIEDGMLTSQVIGPSFQDYNFYENYMSLFDKNFVSPLSDQWKGYYKYILEDSLIIEGKKTYRLYVRPKNKLDLAFTGYIWVTADNYALKQVELTINQTANLNYIESVKIQQQLNEVEPGIWLPTNTRLIVDIAELSENYPGLLAKFYTHNSNFSINTEHKARFYDQKIEVDPNAREHDDDDEFWQKNRGEPLSETEQNVYKMIDTIKTLPTVKTYVEIIKILVNGYKKVGPVDVGPYLLSYAWNEVEGHRFRLGFKTNISFSKWLVLRGYGAYGTRDETFKYGGGIDVILSKKYWTAISVDHKFDIDQVGLASEEIQDNSLFYAFSNFFNLIRPYYSTQTSLTFQKEVLKGFTQSIQVRNRHFKPLFGFAYLDNYEDPASPIKEEFTTTEVVLETRITRQETFVINDNERISLGSKWPILTVRYTKGFKGSLNGDFDYDKLDITVKQDFKVGPFGKSSYIARAGKVFSPVPYPLLKVHIGNESPFFTTAAYNLMDFFEFVSDQYASLSYTHRFEGFLFNRIPLMKKLKWRFFTTANVLVGSAENKNFEIISPLDNAGNLVPGFTSLGKAPYVELGYGIENIFKIGRVDFIHRLTYLKDRDVNPFGIKFSVQFIL